MTNPQEQKRPLIGQIVAGRYEIKELLGEGGMSEVYLASDNNIYGSQVAVKVLSLQESGILERFIEEAKGQAHLGKHPNICGVKDTVKENNKLKYIIMDFIPGESFQNFILRNHKKLQELSTQRIMVQIILEACRALHYAHTTQLPGRDDTGIIHRDIKPENIMLQDLGDGRLSPVLVDFGLCRIGMGVGYTSDSRIFGTPIFASPEQLLTPTSVMHLSDIFSMGLILYWIFAGERFYDAAEELSAFGIVPYYQSRLQERLALIRDPAALAIVTKAIAENPGERYQSAAELADELQAFLNAQPEEQTPQIAASQSPTLHYSNRPTKQPGRTVETIIVSHSAVNTRKVPSETMQIQSKEPKKRSKVIAFAALAAVVIAGLITGAIYFSSQGKPNRSKKQDTTTSKMAAPKAMQQPMSMKASAQIAARKSPKPVKKVNEAQKLFEQWKGECLKTDPMRDYFKNTPTYYSACVRRKKARPYIKRTNSFVVGRQMVKLLRKNFCTAYNLKYDKNMKKECRKIARMLISIEAWEKLHNCQKALTLLMKKGDIDETGLPGKCNKMRWYLNPKPKFAHECRKSYKRSGPKKITAKCKLLFSSFPSLIPK